MKCHLKPQSIVMVGHKEAATVALTLAAVWYKVDFGGVIAVDGIFPIQYQPQSVSKAKAPALILRTNGRGPNDDGTNAAANFFDCLEFQGSLDEQNLPSYQHNLRPIVDFLGHRLRHDEWKKQAVLSFGKPSNSM